MCVIKSAPRGLHLSQSAVLKMAAQQQKAPPDVARIAVLENSSNYVIWASHLKILFDSKDLTGIVDGTIPIDDLPQEDVGLWKERDAQAKLYIIQTCAPHIQKHLLTCETSEAMFAKLKNLYEQDTDHQKNMLMEKLYAYKWDRELSAIDNTGAIINLAHQLNSLDQEINNVAVMSKIVSILPPTLDHFSTAWDSVPQAEKTIENLVHRLQREEDKIKNSSKEDGKSAFLAYKPSTHSENKHKDSVKNRISCTRCGGLGHSESECRSKVYCKLCRKTNHFTKDCFFKNKTDRKRWCHNCRNTSHETRDCRKRQPDKSHHKRQWSPKRRRRSPSPSKVCSVETRPKSKTNTLQTLSVTDNNKTKVTATCNLSTTPIDLGVSKPCGLGGPPMTIDSGATGSMVNDIKLLTNIKTDHSKIMLAKDGAYMTSTKSGTLNGLHHKIKPTLFVPELTTNLLSVGDITKCGGAVLLDQAGVKILKSTVDVPDSLVSVMGNRTATGLYEVNLPMNKSTTATYLATTCKNDLINLHRKLGHMSFTYMKQLPSMSKGINIAKTATPEICDVCDKAKQVAAPHKIKRDRAPRILKIIHSDVCGPIEPPTYDGKTYFVTFIDDYSHYCEVSLLESKSEVYEELKAFVMSAENRHDRKVWKIRCDNGGEYTSNKLKWWCKDHGIVLDHSLPRTPQQAGTAERMNKTLLEKTRALIFDSNLPAYMWGEAVLTATYLSNRSPSKTVSKLPAEIWTGKVQDLSTLQIFGTIVHAKITTYLKKLDSRSNIEAIFVGYGQHGYRLWDPITRKIFQSKDVTFTNKLAKLLDNDSTTEIVYKLDEKHNNLPRMDINPSEQPFDDSQDVSENRHHTHEDRINRVIPSHTKYTLRNRNELKTPVRFRDYKLYLCTASGSAVSFESQISDPKWKMAVQDEMDSLNKNQVWKYVDIDKAAGQPVISSRWIFKIKEDGTHRARLVARGFEQSTHSLDYSQTYSPVVDTSNLRALLALAAYNNLSIKTFDVKTAFLHGTLTSPVYMLIPEGYNSPDNNAKICELKKALYGLKEAPQRWYSRLSNFLILLGMNQTKSDKCIFINKTRSLILGIHVDDGILLGSNQPDMDKLLIKLQTQFEIKIHHNPSVYLGMEITRTPKGILLTQTAYADKVLHQYRMENCHSESFPMEPQKKTYRLLR